MQNKSQKEKWNRNITKLVQEKKENKDGVTLPPQFGKRIWYSDN